MFIYIHYFIFYKISFGVLYVYLYIYIYVCIYIFFIYVFRQIYILCIELKNIYREAEMNLNLIIIDTIIWDIIIDILMEWIEWIEWIIMVDHQEGVIIEDIIEIIYNIISIKNVLFFLLFISIFDVSFMMINTVYV